ncbi:MAG: hypothetical protein DPW09_36215 [Anaerolineae bacterium]|nr:ribonuclease HI [Anaerolineales bacterium]MCQ3978900.1 hypothetical protein [Anaerolineae bacterium]
MSHYHTIIHTDGGCSPNPGEGAYVAILQNGDRAACVRGYAPYATNQQMELAAAIAGLSALKSTKIPVQVYTDSQYVQAGASAWINGWRRNGWKNRQGELLANVELWQELDQLMNRFVISWHKVDGHAGVEFNIKADHLVGDTRQARGIASRYQITDIPTIESTWQFEAFQKSNVNPLVAQMRKDLAGLLDPNLSTDITTSLANLQAKLRKE